MTAQPSSQQSERRSFIHGVGSLTVTINNGPHAMARGAHVTTQEACEVVASVLPVVPVAEVCAVAEKMVRLDDVIAALRQYDDDVQELGWEDAVGEHPADTVLRSLTAAECQSEGCSERTTGIYCGAHVAPMTGMQQR